MNLKLFLVALAFSIFVASAVTAQREERVLSEYLNYLTEQGGYSFTEALKELQSLKLGKESLIQSYIKTEQDLENLRQSASKQSDVTLDEKQYQPSELPDWEALDSTNSFKDNSDASYDENQEPFWQTGQAWRTMSDIDASSETEPPRFQLVGIKEDTNEAGMPCGEINIRRLTQQTVKIRVVNIGSANIHKLEIFADDTIMGIKTLAEPQFFALQTGEAKEVTLTIFTTETANIGTHELKITAYAPGEHALSCDATLAVVVKEKALLWPLTYLPIPLYSVAIVGYLSHLVLDMSNKEGIFFTWPLGHRWVFPKSEQYRIAVGSPAEKPLRWLMVGMALLLFLFHTKGPTSLLHQILATPGAASTEYYQQLLREQRVEARISGIWTKSQGVLENESFEIIAADSAAIYVRRNASPDKIYCVSEGGFSSISHAKVKAIKMGKAEDFSAFFFFGKVG